MQVSGHQIKIMTYFSHGLRVHRQLVAYNAYMDNPGLQSTIGLMISMTLLIGTMAYFQNRIYHINLKNIFWYYSPIFNASSASNPLITLSSISSKDWNILSAPLFSESNFHFINILKSAKTLSSHPFPKHLFYFIEDYQAL